MGGWVGGGVVGLRQEVYVYVYVDFLVLGIDMSGLHII